MNNTYIFSYSLDTLAEKYNQSIPNIKVNLVMSAETENKIFLKRWLSTNNVLMRTEKGTGRVQGISLPEVVEYILRMGVA